MEYESPFCVIFGVTVPPHEPELEEQRFTETEVIVLSAVHSPTISSPGPKVEPAEGLIQVTSGVALTSKAAMRSIKKAKLTI